MNEATFLLALHEDPSDDVTWLALADWLEDDGQPQRAELVRLERHLRGKRPARRAEAERRLAELLVAGVRPAVPEVVNSIGMRLALIPPGTFRMGAQKTEPDYDREELAHDVEISRAFYLGVYPVKQKQYAEVMGKNVATFRARGRNSGSVVGLDTSDFPVEQATWDQAVEFCRRLSDAEPGRTYRLPSEAEWEYACRAGTTTPFCFGDTIDLTLANFEGHQGQGRKVGGVAVLARPCPVGSYRPNAFGLYDVHGNVLEWCNDWYEPGYYRHSPERDPPGPPDGQYRVARGGCWYHHLGLIRSAFRNSVPPHKEDSCIGFRVAMTARG